MRVVVVVVYTRQSVREVGTDPWLNWFILLARVTKTESRAGVPEWTIHLYGHGESKLLVIADTWDSYSSVQTTPQERK